VIAVNKPVGQVVHPAPGNWNGTLVNALAFYFQAQGFGVNVRGDLAELRPGIVHRLDKGTSGVIIAAKTADAAAHLSAAFKARAVSKTYLGAAVGLPAPGAATTGPSYAPGTASVTAPCRAGVGAHSSGAGGGTCGGTGGGTGGGAGLPYGCVTVAEPLARDPVSRFKVAVMPHGKPARSTVTPVGFNGKVSLVKVWPFAHFWVYFVTRHMW